MSSPRTGISCRIACRWRARRATPASRFMWRRAWSMAPPRSAPKASCCIRCRSCAAGISPFGTIATIRALRRHSPRRSRPAIVASCRVAGHGARIDCGAGAAGELRQRADRARLHLHLGQRQGACCCGRCLSALLRLLFNRPRQVVLVQNPDDRDGMLSLGIARRAHRADPRLGRRRRSAAAACPSRPAPPTVAFVGRLLADKGIRTLIARPPAAAPARLERRTADRRHAGSGQSRLGERAGGRRLEPGARHHLARPCRGHLGALGARAYRGAAVAARGPAEKPARGRGLRPADDRHRRPGLPRNRASPAKPACSCPYDDAAGAGHAPSRRWRRRRACGPDMGAAARRLAVERFSAEAIGRQTVDLYRSLVGRGGQREQRDCGSLMMNSAELALVVAARGRRSAPASSSHCCRCCGATRWPIPTRARRTASRRRRAAASPSSPRRSPSPPARIAIGPRAGIRSGLARLVLAAAAFIAVGRGLRTISGRIEVAPRLVAASARRRHRDRGPAGRASRRAGAAVVGRARAAAARLSVVRQSHQLHGRHRLDDGRRIRAGHASGLSLIGWLGALPMRGVLVALALCGGVDRLCAVQPPGRAHLSRRRRQPADRSAARLAARAGRRPAAISPRRWCCRSTISPMRR